MRRAARGLAILLAIGGLALFVAAAVIATTNFKAPSGPNGGGAEYNCGSVLFTKDPRNTISRKSAVPQRLRLAYQRCERMRTRRTDRALKYLIAGVIPLVLVLALPAITRNSRRAKVRMRMRM